ncbi:hypothetical protein [Streptomyces sp. NPDC088915]|uniref:hypothetical protein n=1 Tax=Streptomyces sp. NPDC088915 TaxID=3365912 RepID=UPI0038121966
MASKTAPTAPTKPTAPVVDVPDARWWVVPLVATVLAPLLSLVTAVRTDLFTDALPVFLVGCFVLPFAAILPAWCRPRTVRERQARNGLAIMGCLLAVVYAWLIETIAMTVFLVMLLTGLGHS